MMEAQPPATVENALRWRYAVKEFDAARRIPVDVWTALERALVLAPSSFGVEPWRFYVVTDPGIREQLRAASWGQSQVTDASHLVVFAIRDRAGAADVDALVDRTAAARGIERASLAKFRQMVVGFLERDGFDVNAWAARQLYIALGTFMTSAAMLGVDTCPLEGIDPDAYDRVLGCREEGYRTTVACAAGYRASGDKYATYPKVRRALDDAIRKR